MTNTRVLAFDFGLRHIGVAVGQSITRTASPLPPLRAKQGVIDQVLLAALLAKWKPDVLLVGLPLNMDGTESEMSASARTFAKSLKDSSHKPVYLIDERLTTFTARGRIMETGRRGREQPDAHGIAAQLIAQSWLAEPEFRWTSID